MHSRRETNQDEKTDEYSGNGVEDARPLRMEADLSELRIVCDHPVGALKWFAGLEAFVHEVVHRALQIFLIERHWGVDAIHFSANLVHEEPTHGEEDSGRREDQLAVYILHDTQVLLCACKTGCQHHVIRAEGNWLSRLMRDQQLLQ